MSCPSDGRGSVCRPTTMMPSTRRLSRAFRWYCSRMWSPRASQRKTFTWPAPKASSAPIRIGMTNRPSRSLVSRPTVPVRPATRLCACWFGEKEIFAAASMTRCAGRGGDLITPVERLGGRRDRDAGERGDVAQRRRLAGGRGFGSCHGHLLRAKTLAVPDY